MKEAYLYEKLENKKVRCFLCSHRCLIKPGSRGICGVRENADGTLTSLVYRQILAKNVDPIEKKPLYHFLPGSRSYSIATAGCNFKCLFCQNADISQMVVDDERIWGQDTPPEIIVEKALATGSATIAYTYTEPTIYFEMAVDTARIAAQKGVRNIFVSNGYMTEECLRNIHPDLHGANVDLKAFSDGFYKEQCGARLAPVLRSIEKMVEMGIWVEVTTLLIPGLNDSEQELRGIADFLCRLDPGIPWHISRFHPTYRLTDVSPTPPESLRRAREIGFEQGLRYVYTGNLPGDEGENTFCHQCGELLIARYGFQVRKNAISGGSCPKCAARVPGVWK
ncbi:MAG: AmmeMemoRadiSam system radical SAM enzyme [Deltaproteobacteria bacterium HGW-Deltaproteobacteria-15]|jgi:pyruvate formate lyase activating enzyme|nr:MAG: AmmeMemoRadiSam system radical SAM enzyme [Deltaproteobacteria bacterium HGW-Deltaproteobacteria-15]